MAFWGVEVKPGKPFKHLPNGGKGRLHVSQATLGIGSATNKSIVQCNVGNKIPVFLCSLFPDKSESSQLNLEFDEADEVVFSVLGPRSVHITGFYLANSRSSRIDDESESYGEDIKDSVTDRSEDNDEYDDSFINDDDPGVLPPSPCSTDEEEKAICMPRKSRRPKKKYQVSESDSQSGDSPQLQNAVNGNGEVEKEEEEEASDSEEAVGSFFKSLDKKKPSTTFKDSNERVDATNKQESVDPAANTKNKKKRKAREVEDTKNSVQSPDEENEQDQNSPSNNNEPEVDTAAEESNTKKKKKKKNKNKKRKSEVRENDVDVDMATEKKIGSEKNGDGESTEARALPNGLIIEEIELGNPDGKVASPGKKVSVHFTGKIKENGKVVDSNADEEPLKFRLGSGEVMGGFDDGIDGMRVGGKRRLTIPPSLRKGSIRLKGKKIGSKASLVYEIEVVRIR